MRPANVSFVQMICQIEFWLSQFGAVALRLQIEVDAGDGLGRLECQSGFARLTRPEQRNGGGVLQFIHQQGKQVAGNNRTSFSALCVQLLNCCQNRLLGLFKNGGRVTFCKQLLLSVV